MSGIMQMMIGRGIFVPTSNVYNSGSGTETVPNGATSCSIEVWGNGGAGQVASGVAQGTGGGGGGYSQKTVAVSSGQTLSYAVGAPSTVTSAAPVVSMTANAGATGVAGGGGGTASGGTINTTGGNGALGSGGSSPNGGGNVGPGVNGIAPGGGGGGGNPPGGAGGGGANGRVSFSYT